MANIYFCFSDECGDYKSHMKDKQVKSHPFYVRTTLLINASEWKFLNCEFRNLKQKYKIPISQELKWAYPWYLKRFQEKDKPIPNNHILKPFEKLSYYKLVDFVDEALSIVNKLNEKKIIVTFTDNRNGYGTSEKSILGFHLQEHMQRIEMELKIKKENLGILFLDPVNPQKNALFQSIYNQLFEGGDFIKKYSCIKDCLNFENSHQSVGIQISDYISGAFSSVLRSTIYNSNYSHSIDMFFDNVYPNLRRSSGGSIQGYGIREVPSSTQTRSWFMNHLQFLKRSREIVKCA